MEGSVTIFRDTAVLVGAGVWEGEMGCCVSCPVNLKQITERLRQMTKGLCSLDWQPFLFVGFPCRAVTH